MPKAPAAVGPLAKVVENHFLPAGAKDDGFAQFVLEQAANDGRCEGFLRQHPLERFTLGPDPHAGTAAGIYNFAETSITINPRRTGQMAAKTRAEPFEIGRSFNVLPAAHDPAGEQTLRIITTHELGHHVYAVALGRPDGQEFLGRIGALWSRRLGGGAVSGYARTDHSEWFAETYAAYVHHGPALRAFDPEAHSFIEATRRSLGMEPIRG